MIGETRTPEQLIMDLDNLTFYVNQIYNQINDFVFKCQKRSGIDEYVYEYNDVIVKQIQYEDYTVVKIKNSECTFNLTDYNGINLLIYKILNNIPFSKAVKL